MDDSRRGVHEAEAIARFVDNGPINRMMDDVSRRCRKLQFRGCVVMGVRVDEFKAVIHVEPCAAIEEHFEESGFGVFQDGRVRLVWRK